MIAAFFYLMGAAATAWRFGCLARKFPRLVSVYYMTGAAFYVLAWPVWWAKVWWIRHRWSR